MAEERAPPNDQQRAVEKSAAERQVAEHEASIARLKLERARDEREAAKFSQPMAAEEAAAQEAALARLQLERATVERDLAKLSKPWWRSWNITALGAFLATIAPATAGVTGYFDKQKQLALEEQKQRHEIAMAQQKQDEDIRSRYLDRLLDPHQTRRTLRLLMATSSDTKVRDWAMNELPFVDQQAKTNDDERTRRFKKADEDEKLLRKLLEEKSSSELVKHAAEVAAKSRAIAEALQFSGETAPKKKCTPGDPLCTDI